MNYKWQRITVNEEQAVILQKQLGIQFIFCKILVDRGIFTFDQAKSYFRPSLAQLPDSFLMMGMEKAVERIKNAIHDRRKIMLFGDYDVDGTTAVALLYEYLRRRTDQIFYYLPDRYKEGYGLSLNAIERAKQENVNLIITLDCGIKSIEEATLAARSGIDLIICDHHLPGESLPEAVAILNPKQLQCPYPYKDLSGCGIAFKLVHALSGNGSSLDEECQSLLDLVALSTACDIVSITEENRVLTYFGLQEINQGIRPGLKALTKATAREAPLSVHDLVFGLGPLVNSAGRLADADVAVKLFLERDPHQAQTYAQVLKQRNGIRKDYDLRTTQEADALLLEDGHWANRMSIVLFQPHWHKGVIGIVAARIAEKYHRPTIILTESEGKLVGSARSARRFDLHKALHDCRHLLLSYGGHAHAAGVSLLLSDLPAFQVNFERSLLQYQEGPIPIEPCIEYADALDFKDITPHFMNIWRQLKPFGPGNTNPVFVSKDIKDTGNGRIMKDAHLQLFLQQEGSVVLHAVAFNMADKYEEIKKREKFDCCYSIHENYWNGRRQVKLMIKDIKFL